MTSFRVAPTPELADARDRGFRRPCDPVCLPSPLGRFVSLVFLMASFALWPNSNPLAQERVLRFHHILPEHSPQQQKVFLPWSKKIAEASNGRLRISVAAGMKLGRKPNELLSQVETKYVAGPG
jgi:TRAP-type C4-dicarboxylate transport system substrate-binding protein